MLHSFEMSIPILVVIWIDAFQATEAAMGLVVGTGLASVGVFAPFTGNFSDRYGSKRLVTISMLGMGIGFFLLSQSQSLLSIAIAILVWGLSASIYHPAGLSLISRHVTNRGIALGYHGAAGSAGTALGPFLTIALLLVFEWQIVVVILTVPAFVAVAFSSLFRFTTEPQNNQSNGPIKKSSDRSSLKGAITDARLLFSGTFTVIFLIQMAYGMYFRGLFTFLPELLSRLQTFNALDLLGKGSSAGQYVYSYLLLVGVGGQYLGGKLSDGYRAERLLVANMGILTLFTLLFLPATKWGIGPLILVSTALGFVLFLSAPITLKLVADYVDESVHGLSYGFTYFGLWGIGSLGAVLAGVLLTYAGRPALFFGLAALALVQTGLSVILIQR